MSRAANERERRLREAMGGVPKVARRGVNRTHAIALGFSVFLAAFGVKLYDLEILRYHEFATQSETNFQRDEIVRALRGEIRTRDGVLLATNRMAVDLFYKGGAVAAWPQIRYLSGVQGETLPSVPQGGEVALARNIAPDRIAALHEYTVLQPNLELRERLERVYPRGTFAAHLLGYVGEANQKEVEGGGYALQDLTGRSGVEASLESALRGRNGVRRVEVMADGRPIAARVVDPGQKGQAITLTIDSTLQRAAEKALQSALGDINKGRAKYGKPPEKVVKGAIIALDPRTGEVLALASSPVYDPNWFAQSPRPPQLVAALKGAGGNALLNRAIQNFDSGSVFKPTSTNAILENYGDPTYNCPTGFVFSGRVWHNWAHRNLGDVDGRGAIAQSCNTWYYQVAAGVPDRTVYAQHLADRAEQLGFGGTTGLELPGEKTGNVPSPKKFAARGQTWWPGFSLNYGIGQGDLLVTPAQIASALSTLENEGQRRPLTLIKAVGGETQAPKPAVQVPGDPKNYQLVKEGLAWTVSTPSGTASTVLGRGRFPVPTAGKTGTAQNAESRRQDSNAYTNSWYEGYGPLPNSDFLVVSFFENGGEGYDVGLPAATRMFAARWCLKLGERLRALPDQTPCTGELGPEVRAKMKQVFYEKTPETATK